MNRFSTLTPVRSQIPKRFPLGCRRRPTLIDHNLGTQGPIPTNEGSIRRPDKQLKIFYNGLTSPLVCHRSWRPEIRHGPRACLGGCAPDASASTRQGLCPPSRRRRTFAPLASSLPFRCNDNVDRLWSACVRSVSPAAPVGMPPIVAMGVGQADRHRSACDHRHPNLKSTHKSQKQICPVQRDSCLPASAAGEAGSGSSRRRQLRQRGHAWELWKATTASSQVSELIDGWVGARRM